MEGLSSEVSVAAPSRSRWSFALSYAALVVLPIVGLIVLLKVGSWMPPPVGEAAAPTAPLAIGRFNLPLLLAQILVILIVSRLVGMVLRRLGQPPVVGEMVAGLLLGSSVLGVLSPGVYDTLFPRGTLRFLNALSQIGILMFMFLVGLDLDRELLARRGRAALLTSHASIAIPMFLSAGLAFLLFEALAVTGERFTPFTLFLGTAMSVTAFPVLARILTDRGLQHSAVGTVALASAAVDDVTAWCVLALVVATTRADAGGLPLWATIGGLILHVALMLGVVRPLLRRHVDRLLAPRGLTTDLVAGVVVITLASAWITESLGVHALFGGFLAGVACPKDARVVEGLKQRFEDVMVVLLLPLFFAITGLRTNIRLLDSPAEWIMCLAVIGVAIVGKFGGSSVAARAGGMSWRDATIVGTLMNTRGLMELVVLNIGLDLGVLTPTLFAMMVLMALTTTLMTTPIVARLVAVPARR